MAPPIDDPLLQRILDSVRAEADPGFEFASPGSLPWCAPPASLSETRVALVTTAALHLKGDRAFRTLEDRLGDTSFRIIPQDAAGPLDLGAPYVDPRHIPNDPEVALPRRALSELHRRGRIGPPSLRHASFSPGIVRGLPGLRESAAALSLLLREDGAGAVILMPTCPLCVQTVCILAREIESRGIPTVCVTLVPDLTRIVGAPRSLAVKFPFGAPCGDPGHGALHRALLLDALSLLAEADTPGTLRESRLAWRRTPPEDA
jgi:hypothetical protein